LSSLKDRLNARSKRRWTAVLVSGVATGASSVGAIAVGTTVGVKGGGFVGSASVGITVALGAAGTPGEAEGSAAARGDGEAPGDDGSTANRTPADAIAMIVSSATGRTDDQGPRLPREGGRAE
jgi:hypothetical protein